MPDGGEHAPWAQVLVSITGHGANSQFGPVRPTAVPSGQIRASWVQAVGLVVVAGVFTLGKESKKVGGVFTQPLKIIPHTNRLKRYFIYT